MSTISTALPAATPSLSAAAESILPYTKGLTGVNLWLNNILG
jgi:hypothetical protein